MHLNVHLHVFMCEVGRGCCWRTVVLHTRSSCVNVLSCQPRSHLHTFAHMHVRVLWRVKDDAVLLVALLNGNDTFAFVDKLEPATHYSFTVRAVNIVGGSSVDSTATFKTNDARKCQLTLV